MNALILKAVSLLVLSNLFTTIAWSAHLKHLSDRLWSIAALTRWGVARFEYLLQVPANRIGYTAPSLPLFKVMQKVITLAVLVPFAVLYMHESVSWNHLLAGLCLLAAAYFIFRG